jgi:hypothetical protein
MSAADQRIGPKWVEPNDALPDVDENPGPSPERRAISGWDQTSIEIGGSA